MADFLGRLAERAVRAGATAQPLIAPIFAPGPALVGDGAAKPFVEEYEQEEATTPLAETNLSTEQMLEAFARSAARLLLPLADRSDKSRSGDGSQDERAHSSPPAAKPTGEATTSSDASRDVSRSSKQNLRPELHRVGEPRQARESESALKDRSKEFDKDFNLESASEQAQPLARQDRQAVLPTVMRPNQAERVEHAAQSRDQKPDASQPSAPVIQVTIGRIEVRAITAARTVAPRPATARSVPLLSLSEYLKQRDEGKR
jgi:hypothetical protein